MSAVLVAYKYYYTELFENGMNEIWNQSKRNEEKSVEISVLCEIEIKTETLRFFLLL